MDFLHFDLVLLELLFGIWLHFRKLFFGFLFAALQLFAQICHLLFSFEQVVCIDIPLRWCYKTYSAYIGPHQVVNGTEELTLLQPWLILQHKAQVLPINDELQIAFVHVNQNPNRATRTNRWRILDLLKTVPNKMSCKAVQAKVELVMRMFRFVLRQFLCQTDHELFTLFGLFINFDFKIVQRVIRTPLCHWKAALNAGQTLRWFGNWEAVVWNDPELAAFSGVKAIVDAYAVRWKIFHTIK